MDDDATERDSDPVANPASGSLESEFEEFSLENLGAAYARAAAAHDPESFVAPANDTSPQDTTNDPSEPLAEEHPDDPVHPQGIVEAALFVGHPHNEPLSAARLAALMRGVSEEEVIEVVDQLNQSYRDCGQALRVVGDETGYQMTIAPAVEDVRRSFLGKVREARLSQAAVEVLALVAYQPGITSQTIQDQRGKDSGAILNQLIRRRLLEMKRETPQSGGRKVPHYYPTERFLSLFGLETLEDLPLVDERFLA